ncbi:MAG: lactonase family protein [Arcicella sp.]|nr:lactonase family protein [Arcicella sp.]
MKLITQTLFVFSVFFITAIFAQKPSKKPTNNDFYLLVGTYTSGKSEGIYTFKFNVKTGEFTPKSIAKNIKNPSFLAISPDSKYVYSAGETDKEGSVHSFEFDKKTGILTPLTTQSAHGNYPCYVAIDKTGKWVICGNYGAGNLSVFPVETDGSLGKATQTIQHEGKSINPGNQESPHVHSINIASNNVDVFVADLGMDKIVTYSLDAKTGKLSSGNPPFTKIKNGSGPRHFEFHPNGKFAYCIQEISGEVVAFEYKKGALNTIQTISTKPADLKGDLNCADLHISPDGKFLYGSNRVHDSLVIYAVDAKTGKLTYVAHQSVLGKKPRNFVIAPSGNFVLVANQDSDNVVIFKRDIMKGTLTPTGKEIAVPNPVCLKMVSF